MEKWSDFFVAIVGAAAALTGLIFVGVSISLSKILSVPRLTGRASESLILLLVVLTVSALCLVPNHSACLIGAEVLAIGVVVWAVSLRLDVEMLRKSEVQFKKYAWQNMLFTQLSIIPYLIAGIMMLCQGYEGIYWLIPGIIFSFIKAVLDAWVLLVEIHR